MQLVFNKLPFQLNAPLKTAWLFVYNNPLTMGTAILIRTELGKCLTNL